MSALLTTAPVVPPPPAHSTSGPTIPSLAHPARGNPAAWFSADSYPIDAVRRGAEGRVVASLRIDSNGRVVGCEVITSSGDASLDVTTCHLSVGKAGFTPAADEHGWPIASSYRLPVRWVLPTDAAPPVSPMRTAAPPSPLTAASSPPHHRRWDFHLLLDALLAMAAAIGEMRQNWHWRRAGLDGPGWDESQTGPVALWRRWPSLRLVIWGALFLALLWLA